MKQQYFLEVVWNREFDFRPYGEPLPNLKAAITAYNQVLSMGDGACVKKARILNRDGKVVYAYGQRVSG